MKVEIYPVPNNGQFSIAVRNGTENACTMEVYNSLGIRVTGSRNLNVHGPGVTTVDLGRFLQAYIP